MLDLLDCNYSMGVMFYVWAKDTHGQEEWRAVPAISVFILYFNSSVRIEDAKAKANMKNVYNKFILNWSVQGLSEEKGKGLANVNMKP